MSASKPFALALAPLVLSASAALAAPPRAIPEAPAGAVEELRSRFAPNARHFRMADGTTVAVIAGAPYQYRDPASGEWRPIDDSVEAGRLPGSPFAALHRPDPLHFPESAAEPLRIDLGEAGTIGWTTLGLAGADGGGLVRASARAAREGDGVVYRDRGGLEQGFSIREGNPEAWLRLRAPDGADRSGRKLRVEGRLTLPDGWTLRSHDAFDAETQEPARIGIDVVDGGGRPVRFLPLPSAHDSAAEPASTAGTLDFEEVASGEWAVVASFDSAWFETRSLAWPVTIVPMAFPNGGWGGHLIYNGSVGSISESNPKTDVTARNTDGSNTYYGYIQWDTTSIPFGAAVSAVSTTLVCSAAVGATNTVLLGDVTNPAPYVSFSAGVWNDLFASSYTSVTIPATGTFGPYALSSAVADLEAHLADRWFAISLRQSTLAGSSEYRRFDSGTSGLTVTYEYAPPRSIVINEVRKASAGWVELYNYGPDTTLTNYQVRVTSGASGTQICTLPTFTLGHHKFVQVLQGSGTNSTTQLFCPGWTTSFTLAGTGQASLVDSSGFGVDYVNWNYPASPSIPYPTTWSSGSMATSNAFVARSSDIDSDNPYGWTDGSSSTALARNPLQVGTRPRSFIRIQDVQVSPAIIEIANSRQTRSLSGWKVYFWANGTQYLYTVPTGGTYTLFPGMRIRLHAGSGSDSVTDWYTGFTVPFSTSASIEVGLVDDGGRGVDHVAVGSLARNHAFAGTNWNGATSVAASDSQILRLGDLDTDDSVDFAGSTVDCIGRQNFGELGTAAEYDETGTAISFYTPSGAPATRGGAGLMFDATTSGTITEFRQVLDIPTPTDLHFAVYEQPTPGSGAWTKLFDRFAPQSGTGRHAYGPGAVNVPFVSGRRYALMAHWAPYTISYAYDGAGQAPHPDFLSVGNFVALAYCDGTIPCYPDTATPSVYPWWSPSFFLSTIPGSYPAPVAIVTTALPSATSGPAYTAQLAAEGGHGGYIWSLAAGSLPPGLSLSASGAISGIAGGNNTYSFTVRVVDGLGQSDTQALSILVYGSGAPQIVTSSLPNGIRGSAYPTQQLVALGGDPAYTWDVISGALPNGLSLGSSGAITGIPTVTGSFSFLARVLDQGLAGDIQSFTILVTDPPSSNAWVRRGVNDSDFSAFGISADIPKPTIVVGTRSALLAKSTDDGASWKLYTVGAGLTGASTITSWSSIAFAPTYSEAIPDGYDKAIFAVVEAGTPRLIRSTDGGASWFDRTPGGATTISKVLVAPSWGSANRYVIAFGGPDDAFVSSDGGQNWVDALTAFSIGQRVIVDMAISSDDRLFFANADSQRTPGLYESTDWGGSWDRLSNLVPTGPLAVSPSFATDRTLFLVLASGLAVSHDGGRTFETGIFAPQAVASIRNLRLIPGFDNGIPTNRGVFLVEQNDSAPPYGRLYLSADGGATFQQADSLDPVEADIPPGQPSLPAPVEAHAAYSTNGTLFHARTGFWISTDRGASWLARATDLGMVIGTVVSPSAGYLPGIVDAVVPTAVCRTGASDRTLFLGTKTSGLFKSADGGTSFTKLKIPSPVNPSAQETEIVSVHPTPSYTENGTNGTLQKTVFVGTPNGVQKSVNGGGTWSVVTLPWNTATYPLSLFRMSPGYDGTTDRTLVAAYVDNTTPATLYRSTDGGASWGLVSTGVPPTGGIHFGDFRFSPSHGSDRFALVQYVANVGSTGSFYKTTNFDAVSPNFSTLDRTNNGRIVFSPTYNDDSGPTAPIAAKTFWIGPQRTEDRGATFATPPSSTLEPLCVAPNYGSTLTLFGDGYHSGFAGKVPSFYRSTDKGTTAVDVTASTALKGMSVAACAVSPGYSTGAGEVFAATTGAGLFRSTDGGLTWLPLAAGSSLPDQVNGAATSPIDDAVMYVAATGEKAAVYKSTDKANTFFPLAEGLCDATGAVTDARSVAVCPISVSVIVVGTAGKGIFRSTDSGASWSQTALTDGTWVNFVYVPGAGPGGVDVLQAANLAGPVVSSSDCGSTWTALAGPSDFVSLSQNYAGGAGAERSVSPRPNPVLGGVWGASGSTGVNRESSVSAREDSPAAGAWTPVNGTGDYAFPYVPCPATSVVAKADQSVLVAGCHDGVGGPRRNLYYSTDAGSPGGDHWQPVNLLDPLHVDFASTTRNVSSCVESPNGDILCGVVGTTDGGVYLSANDGEHWVILNEGFDPASLSISNLIHDSGIGGAVTYYSGKLQDGFWSRTITPAATPTILNLSSAGGSQTGGGNLTITGQNFQSGAVAEFDKVRCTSTSYISPTQLQCVGIPPHFPGAVQVRVRNPDTRTGYYSSYTYTVAGGGAQIALTSVTKSGANNVLAWTDPGAKGNYRVYRSTSPQFSGIVEAYPKAGEPAITGSPFTDTRNSPALGSSEPTYYYFVE